MSPKRKRSPKNNSFVSLDQVDIVEKEGGDEGNGVGKGKEGEEEEEEEETPYSKQDCNGTNIASLRRGDGRVFTINQSVKLGKYNKWGNINWKIVKMKSNCVGVRVAWLDEGWDKDYWQCYLPMCMIKHSTENRIPFRQEVFVEARLRAKWCKDYYNVALLPSDNDAPLIAEYRGDLVLIHAVSDREKSCWDIWVPIEHIK